MKKEYFKRFSKIQSSKLKSSLIKLKSNYQKKNPLPKMRTKQEMRKKDNEQSLKNKSWKQKKY